MAAINNNSAAIYLTISDGKLCRRFSAPTATSKERVNKLGKLVHEEHYDRWKGKIISVKTRESEYGKDWVIEIKDGEETALLSFKYSSGYAASFLKALPNVNLDQEVIISPLLKEEDGKKKSVIFLHQNGGPVKWYYTKATPNGLPGLKQIKVKGQTTWDDSDMMEFLEKMVTEIFDKAPF